MLQVKLIPEECLKEDGAFTGYIVLNTPSFQERIAVLDIANLAADENGEIKTKTTDSLKMFAKVLTAIKDSFAEVALVHKESNYIIKDYETLIRFPGSDPIIADVVNKFFSGFKLGNGLKLI
jgi:hypothetical protein